MTAAVGALHADIGASSAAFAADMGKASRALKSGSAKMNRSLGLLDKGFLKVRRGIGGSVKSLFSLKGAIIGLAGGGGLGLLIKRAIDTGDTIAKVADKVGLSTDSLQELRFAAGKSGVEVRTLDMAMQRFSRRVGEVAKGGGELKGTFESLNISVRDADGALKTQDQLLNELADAIKNAGSEQERLAIAFKAFDSEGAAFVNALRGGSAGLDAFRARARELGIVLNEKLVRGSIGAKDAFFELGRVLSTTFTKAILTNADMIADVAERIVAAAPAVIRVVGGMADAVARIMGAESKAAELERLTDALARFRALEAEQGGDKKVRVGDRALSKSLGLTPGKQQIRFVIHSIEEMSEALRAEIELEKSAAEAGLKAAAVRAAADASAVAAAKVLNRALERRIQLDEGFARLQQVRVSEERLRIAAKEEQALDRLIRRGEVQNQMLRDTAAAEDKVSLAAETMGDAVGRNLLGIINRSNSAAGAVRNLAFELANAVFREVVISRVVERATGFFENIPGLQAKAHGGPVRRNVPVLVGERGPEIFSPPSNGSILPNSRIGRGGGGNVTYNIDARGADEGAVRRIAQVLESHIRATPAIALASVNNARNRDG